MGFSDGSWKQRLVLMGDEAEEVFEKVYPKGLARYGLRRPPIRVAKLPAFIRYTPDYLTTDNLVEVMGVGEDQRLKLKIEKAITLERWHKEMDVKLFLWDSHKRRHCSIPYMKLLADVAHIGKIDKFPEGKAYWGVDINKLEAQWETISESG